MKNPFAILALFFGVPLFATVDTSANAESAAVVQVVQQFFDALHNKDGTTLAAICQPGAQFSSGRPAPEGRRFRDGSGDGTRSEIIDRR